MPADRDPPPPASNAIVWARRLLPLFVLAVAAGIVFGMGWHRYLSFETLARHYAVLEDFVARNTVAAVAGYIALYVVVVALSIPGAHGPDGGRRNPVRRARRRQRGAGRRDHRRDLHFPDRQERGRRASGAPRRSACRTACRRFSRRRLQLSPVPAAGVRCFRSGWSIWCRRCPGCGCRPSSRRPRSASFPRTFAFAFVGAGLDSAIAAQQAPTTPACPAAGRAIAGSISISRRRSRRSFLPHWRRSAWSRSSRSW